MGSGGFAEVYRARVDGTHGADSTIRAVKVFTRLGRPTPTGDLDDVWREVTATQKLHHPLIARLYGVEWLKAPDGLEYPALVLDWLDGVPLSSFDGAPRWRHDVLRLLDWMADVLEALDVANTRGIYHGDITPRNLMWIHGTDRVVTIDWGLGRLWGRHDSPGGTLGYIAPELLGSGEPSDARSDLFSLGGVFHLLATGRPFLRMGEHYRVSPASPIATMAVGRTRSPQTISTAVDRADVVLTDAWPSMQLPGVAAVFGQMLRGALERDPRRRFDSAAQMREEVERARRRILGWTPDAAKDRRNPFVGDRPFDQEDAAWCFGREADARRLRRMIEGTDTPFGRGDSALTETPKKILLHIGPSGWGKSSVVRAVLAPALTHSGDWIVRLIQPGETPLERVRLAIAALFAECTVSQCDVPGSQFLGNHVLLIVDQLEEIFDARVSSQQRCAFFQALLEFRRTKPASLDGVQAHLLVCSRDDGFGAIRELGALGKLFLDECTVHQGEPISEQSLLDALTKPGALVTPRVRFDDGVAEALVAGLRREETPLPYLQALADEMWQWSRGRDEANANESAQPSNEQDPLRGGHIATVHLSARDFAVSGGTRQMLSRFHSRALGTLERRDRRVANAVLVSLVDLNTAEGKTRARTELRRWWWGRRRFAHILNVLLDHRLLQPAEPGPSARDRLRLPSESLRRNWGEFDVLRRRARRWQTTRAVVALISILAAVGTLLAFTLDKMRAQESAERERVETEVMALAERERVETLLQAFGDRYLLHLAELEQPALTLPIIGAVSDFAWQTLTSSVSFQWDSNEELLRLYATTEILRAVAWGESEQFAKSVEIYSHLRRLASFAMRFGISTLEEHRAITLIVSADLSSLELGGRSADADLREAREAIDRAARPLRFDGGLAEFHYYDALASHQLRNDRIEAARDSISKLHESLVIAREAAPPISEARWLRLGAVVDALRAKLATAQGEHAAASTYWSQTVQDYRNATVLAPGNLGYHRHLIYHLGMLSTAQHRLGLVAGYEQTCGEIASQATSLLKLSNGADQLSTAILIAVGGCTRLTSLLREALMAKFQTGSFHYETGYCVLAIALWSDLFNEFPEPFPVGLPWNSNPTFVDAVSALQSCSAEERYSAHPTEARRELNGALLELVTIGPPLSFTNAIGLVDAVSTTNLDGFASSLSALRDSAKRHPAIFGPGFDVLLNSIADESGAARRAGIDLGMALLTTSPIASRGAH